MTTPIWTPSPARIERAHLTRFRGDASRIAGRELADYDALYDWSLEDPGAFWDLLWSFTQVRGDRGTGPALAGPGMLDARWFEGARLNFAENLLRWDDDHLAVLALDDRGSAPIRITYKALRQRVARFQAWLIRQGVEQGDRVAAFMPNRVETLVAMLAATGLGAVFSSCSPDFGLRGVLDRFGQIEPKVLLAACSAGYGGKTHDLMPRIREITGALPTLAATVLVPGPASAPVDAGMTSWELTQQDEDARLVTTPLPFDHPAYIMYSSGTTGKPKCIVHGAGGTLLQHAKELLLHTDIHRDDRVFYFTTCGWMMWNWLVSTLFTGATVVLWDGSPAWPDASALWRMAADHDITVFGTSPKFLGMCDTSGISPGKDHDLSALRAVLSTGAPLSDEGFHWVHNHVGKDVQIASICGGTDIISCFMLGCPTEAVYPGEIQKRGLGMAVEAWRGAHHPVVGEKGELVCTKPFPSMPVGFWNDPDDARYHGAYFGHFPGIWRHGDFVEITETGGVRVFGRSDATLNPSGVRIGTAEIYRPVEAMPDVSEALAVGLPRGDDVEIVLFVVLTPESTLDDVLRRAIRTTIRRAASPRHVPKQIHEVPALPRTLSGKKVELAVTRVLTGQPVTNRDALANPDALDHFAALAPTLMPSSA